MAQVTETTTATAPEVDPATRVFSVSILISAIRCTLTYVLFPWVLPAVGVAKGIGPGIGLIVGLVALASNAASIRRFWVSRHRWRWPITFINGGVFILVTMLVIDDISELLH